MYKLRFPKFSLRTLIIVISILGIGFAVYGNYFSQVIRQKRMIAWVQRNQGSFMYNDSIIDIGSVPPPPKLLDLFVDDFISTINGIDLSYKQVDDLTLLSSLDQIKYARLNNTLVNDLSALSGLKELQTIFLDNSPVDDLSPLSNLEHLRMLSLSGTHVTDLSPLSNLTKIELLYLEGTQITDLTPIQNFSDLELLICNNTPISDLSPLSQLDNLSVLYLSNTKVSDLSPLRHLTDLSYINLENTPVTDLKPLYKAGCHLLTLRGCKISEAEIKAFEAAVPDCKILRPNDPLPVPFKLIFP
ncbi:MAG: hypothetical protein COA78_08640 [Blastopirellula sp.]|nr:MAG: hypothetical protein COA78_08640 [Blastopirellula sp.]